jgi:hypothetical protein
MSIHTEDNLTTVSIDDKPFMVAADIDCLKLMIAFAKLTLMKSKQQNMEVFSV